MLSNYTILNGDSIIINGIKIPQRTLTNITPKGYDVIDTSFSEKKNDVKSDLKIYKGVEVEYYYEKILRIGNKPLHSVNVLKKI